MSTRSRGLVFEAMANGVSDMMIVSEWREGQICSCTSGSVVYLHLGLAPSQINDYGEVSEKRPAICKSLDLLEQGLS